MPFASINPTNPRTNPWNFREEILRIGDFENLSFFESAILKKKFKKIIYFFPSSPWRLVKVSWVARMGRNFDDYPGFQLFFTQINHLCPECISELWGGSNSVTLLVSCSEYPNRKPFLLTVFLVHTWLTISGHFLWAEMEGCNPVNQPICEKLTKWHFLIHALNLKLVWAKLLHLKW